MCVVELGFCGDGGGINGFKFVGNEGVGEVFKVFFVYYLFDVVDFRLFVVEWSEEFYIVVW